MLIGYLHMTFGIDYGSKMAGTTVIAYQESAGDIRLVQSAKNQDADQMILNQVELLKPDLVGIDAPLSLPGVYTGLEGCEDYFYRQSDKQAGAMSPMFLGGLTARAMRLKKQLNERGVEVIEVYPVKSATQLDLQRFGYRKKEVKTEELLNSLKTVGLQVDLSQSYRSHDIDALLAYRTTVQFTQGEALQFGAEREGIIYY